MWQCHELLLVVAPSDWLANSSIHWQMSQLIDFPWLDNTLVFAQNLGSIKSVDILGDFQNAWNNFIKTGQVWALIIGLVFGWGFRSFIGG